MSFALTMTKLIYGPKFKPFISVTVNELLFGYEDTLVNMAHTFYPRNIRPDMSKMGLLLGVSECTFNNFNTHTQTLIAMIFEFVVTTAKRYSYRGINYKYRSQWYGKIWLSGSFEWHEPITILG